MLEAIKRNGAILAGLIVCGWICSLALPAVLSDRGASGPTLLDSRSPMMALIAVSLCIGAAAVVAGLIARISNGAVGLFVLGAGLFVFASRLDTVRELALSNGSGGAAIVLLGIEALIWAIIIFGGVALVFAIGGSLKDVEPDEAGVRPHPLVSADALKSAAAGVVVLPVVWLIAQSEMKGQVIAAATIGGIVAGLAGRLLAPHVQPMLLFVSPIVFGGVGYFAASFAVSQPLDLMYIANALPRLCRPMPVDYAAGSLMGVAIGLGWAPSFLHHEDEVSGARAAEA